MVNHQASLAWVAQAAEAGSLIAQLFPLVLIFGIFWFLVIRPMRQQQKRRQEIVDNLKRGDQVVTNGGVFGEVAAIDSSTVHLKVSDNTKIKVLRSAIAGLQGDTEGEKP